MEQTTQIYEQSHSQYNAQNCIFKAYNLDDLCSVQNIDNLFNKLSEDKLKDYAECNVCLETIHENVYNPCDCKVFSIHRKCLPNKTFRCCRCGVYYGGNHRLLFFWSRCRASSKKESRCTSYAVFNKRFCGQHETKTYRYFCAKRTF